MIESGKESILAIAEEAANWHIIFETEDVVTESDRREFVEWLRRSPTNIAEFMRVRAMQGLFSDINLTELPSVEALIIEARSNVVEISEARAKTPVKIASRPSAQMTRKQFMSGIAAMLVLGIISLAWMAGGWLGKTNFDPSGSYVIETALGEQRSALLEDGSVVNLNTLSKLEVNYSDDVRLVKLLSGEAFFDVAKDSTRPFRVLAGYATMEAIGTQFNVYKQRTETVITVIEGKVAVSSSKDAIDLDIGQAELPDYLPDGNAVQLAPGNQVAVLLSGAIATTTDVDPGNTTAWTKRRLVFNGDSLEVVARELNRYNLKQLKIGTPEILQKTISGIFNANDPETLIAFLEEVGGLRVEVDFAGSGWTLYADLTIPKSPLD